VPAGRRNQRSQKRKDATRRKGLENVKTNLSTSNIEQKREQQSKTAKPHKNERGDATAWQGLSPLPPKLPLIPKRLRGRGKRLLTINLILIF